MSCLYAALIQEREAAATEIERLRKQLQHKDLSRARSVQSESTLPVPSPPHAVVQSPISPGLLLRASEIRKIIGISHSTLYSWLADGAFPRPVRISARSVRWRSDDVIAWRDGLNDRNPEYLP